MPNGKQVQPGNDKPKKRQISHQFIIMIRFMVTMLITLAVSFGLQGQVKYGENRIVFTKEQDILLTTERDTAYERFTPTFAEINISDSVVQNYFVSKELARDIHKYFRQYVGLKKKEKKYIFINALCEKGDGFTKNISLVMGGGRCYFQTDVNITDQKILTFNFNASL